LIAGAALLAFAVAGFGGAEQAEAQSRFSIGFSYGPSYGFYRGYPGAYPRGYSYRRQSAPIYHAPSVHYDRVYHPEYYHWTPGRGVHTHGHYDAVPHYVPGHFDRLHGNHIDVNPYFDH
jgi:hypothetical protein